MEDLMHAYDLAQRGERDTGWIQFCGAHLGVSSEEDGLVYVWDTNAPTDTDNQFDVEELTMKQYLNEVEHFVHDEIAPELAQ